MNLGFLLAIAKLPELPSTHTAIGGDIQRKPESSGRSSGQSAREQFISSDQMAFSPLEFQSKLE